MELDLATPIPFFVLLTIMSRVPFYIYIYICVCVCVCVYVYMCACVKEYVSDPMT